MAAFSLTSGIGLALSIVVLGILFLAWLVAIFMVVVDRIPLGAKILWFLAITVLAPIAIPVYFIVRWRRGGQEPVARTV